MNKITVVCHKDHLHGYEAFEGKCLLCEMEKLYAEINQITHQLYDYRAAFIRARDREWVGFTAAELEKIIPMLVKSFINHDEKTLFLLVGAMLVDIEDQLKGKNGYGLEVYGPPTDFIGPSVVEAISKREWVGLTEEEVDQCHADTADEFQFYQAIEAKLKEKNT